MEVLPSKSWPEPSGSIPANSSIPAIISLGLGISSVFPSQKLLLCGSIFSLSPHIWLPGGLEGSGKVCLHWRLSLEPNFMDDVNLIYYLVQNDEMLTPVDLDLVCLTCLEPLCHPTTFLSNQMLLQIAILDKCEEQRTIFTIKT